MQQQRNGPDLLPWFLGIAGLLLSIWGLLENNYLRATAFLRFGLGYLLQSILDVQQRQREATAPSTRGRSLIRGAQLLGLLLLVVAILRR
jgi:hypothetical protein